MNLKVSHHKPQCSKYVQKHDKFMTPLYKIKKVDTNLRKPMENYFISRLRPDLNQYISLGK